MGIKYAMILFSTILISSLYVTAFNAGTGALKLEKSTEPVYDLSSYSVHTTWETADASVSAYKPNPRTGDSGLTVAVADIGYGIAFVFLALAVFLLRPFIPINKIISKIKEKFNFFL